MKQKMILSREQNEEKAKIMHLKFIQYDRNNVYIKTTNCFVSVTDRANLFIYATRFNLDDVYTRTSFYDRKEILFPANILSHKHCMNKNSFSGINTTCSELSVVI